MKKATLSDFTPEEIRFLVVGAQAMLPPDDISLEEGVSPRGKTTNSSKNELLNEEKTD